MLSRGRDRIEQLNAIRRGNGRYDENSSQNCRAQVKIAEPRGGKIIWDLAMRMAWPIFSDSEMLSNYHRRYAAPLELFAQCHDRAFDFIADAS